METNSSDSLPPEKLPDDLRKVLDFWHSLQSDGGDGLPSLRQFDLMRLPPRLIPLTMVIDLDGDLNNARYRFWGSTLSRIHGRDMTGRCPYDLKPKKFADLLRAEHKMVIDRAGPDARLLFFQTEELIRHYQALLRLPLSANDDLDRQTVAHLVVVVDYTKETIRWLKKSKKTLADLGGSKNAL